MSRSDFGAWQPIDTAPRNGARLLVVIRASEQGAGEVDVVKWGHPQHSSDECWIAVDSDAECKFVYTDTELVFWMPLPTNFPTRRAALLDADLPEPPYASEAGGSGI
jgi:hypothetical protein